MADGSLILLADGREDLRSACGSATIAVWHLFQMYQTAFERGRHRLCAVVDSELVQNVGKVGFYRARTQEQGGFDFFVALSRYQ